MTLARHSCDTSSRIAFLSQDGLPVSDMGKWLYLQDICHKLLPRSWCPPPGALALLRQRRRLDLQKNRLSYSRALLLLLSCHDWPEAQRKLPMLPVHLASPQKWSPVLKLHFLDLERSDSFSSPNSSCWAQGIKGCAGTSGMPAKANWRNTKTTYLCRLMLSISYSRCNSPQLH